MTQKKNNSVFYKGSKVVLVALATLLFLFSIISVQAVTIGSNNMTYGVSILNPTSSLASGGNVTSVSSGDGCIFVSPTIGDVVITFNTSCGSGGLTAVNALGPYLNRSISGTTVSIQFNETQLNLTILSQALRAGLNSTYNATYNSFAYNQTYLNNSLGTNRSNCWYNDCGGFRRQANQDTNTTNSPIFAGGTFNGQLNSDNPSGLGTWHKYTILGGLFQIGQVTSENSVFQIMGTGFDTYFGNISLSYFGADTIGQALIGSIRTLKVIMPGGTTFEHNGTKTSIKSANLDFNGTSIDGVNARTINYTNANITSLHQTYNKNAENLNTNLVNNHTRPICISLTFESSVIAVTDSAYITMYRNGVMVSQEGIREYGVDSNNLQIESHNLFGCVQPGDTYSFNETETSDGVQFMRIDTVVL